MSIPPRIITTWAALLEVIAARVATVEGVTESAAFVDQLRPGAGSALAHKEFAVGIVDAPYQAGRQGAGEIRVKTNLRVRYGFRLQPSDQSVSYREACGLGQTIVSKCVSPDIRNDWPQGIDCDFVRFIPSTDPAGEWFLGEILLSCAHPFTVAG